jgi:hypothetical protein
MGKLIDLAEVRRARQKRVAQSEREALERAVELIDLNVAFAQYQLRQADFLTRRELIERIRKLTAVLQYGTALLGSSTDPPVQA